jgi:hypothetical protein
VSDKFNELRSIHLKLQNLDDWHPDKGIIQCRSPFWDVLYEAFIERMNEEYVLTPKKTKGESHE